MLRSVLALVASGFLIGCNDVPTSPDAAQMPGSLTLAGQGGGGGGSTSQTGVVFSLGFERGPVSPENTPGLRTSSDSHALVQWRQGIARTGVAAYRMRGGDLSGEAAIYNQTRSLPLGGLETWTGGAFYFVTFPRPTVPRPVWLMVAVPTNGSAGANDKPVAAIRPDGKLALVASNGTAQSVLEVPLSAGRWYFLVLHGLNGVGRRQELYLYDGVTGLPLGSTSLVMNVTGNFVNPISKWGFGSAQDASGVEYYVDDIYHARGSTNPGPIRPSDTGGDGGGGGGGGGSK